MIHYYPLHEVPHVISAVNFNFHEVSRNYCPSAQMVLLSLRFTLFKNFPKRAKTFPEQVHQGIFHGKGYMYGHETTFSGKK